MQHISEILAASQIRDRALRLRAENCAWLCCALESCDPHDAAAICAAYLESTETGGPLHDPLDFCFRGAAIWAEIAPAHELAAYTLAGLKRLARVPVGIPTRKKVFAELWAAFPEKDRRAFLARVDADGQFHGRSAA